MHTHPASRFGGAVSWGVVPCAHIELGCPATHDTLVFSISFASSLLTEGAL